MVIQITPRGRDKFNDLATLKITYAKDSIETPNRIVNRHDLNAKDNIGADISLTDASKTFIVQENIDPIELKKILTQNGFMDEIIKKLRPYAERVETSKSLVLLYPHLTAEARKQLTTDQSHEFVRFFADIALILNLESVVLPAFGDLQAQLRLVTKRNLQMIPVLDLKQRDTELLFKQYTFARQTGHRDIPIIAFKYASYPKANKGYNLVMDDLDKLHEAKQATMIVNSPRVIPFNPKSISAPHYVPFFMADLVAETYRVASWSPPKEDEIDKDKPKTVRIFCRDGLVAPETNTESFAENFNLNEEKKVFSTDPKLQELFERMATNTLDEHDWKYRRPSNLSRVHENIRTREEFKKLQKSIEDRSARDYLSEKTEMDAVITKELKSRKSDS
ncbi:MAG: hypothetical protein HRF40_00535 [Nitrososphaera sp.]|jgi:hypothetical protein